ncbi:uncharacterized protein LOC141853263 [Brevipalpus obovatus]|uniref:uncharacterized protein LOC141853263 n=1 Tax=Brevipalpus obovatus TaxID=246614 RepID=UPI003D9F7141
MFIETNGSDEMVLVDNPSGKSKSSNNWTKNIFNHWKKKGTNSKSSKQCDSTPVSESIDQQQQQQSHHDQQQQLLLRQYKSHHQYHHQQSHALMIGSVAVRGHPGFFHHQHQSQYQSPHHVSMPNATTVLRHSKFNSVSAATGHNMGYIMSSNHNGGGGGGGPSMTGVYPSATLSYRYPPTMGGVGGMINGPSSMTMHASIRPTSRHYRQTIISHNPWDSGGDGGNSVQGSQFNGRPCGNSSNGLEQVDCTCRESNWMSSCQATSHHQFPPPPPPLPQSASSLSSHDHHHQQSSSSSLCPPSRKNASDSVRSHRSIRTSVTSSVYAEEQRTVTTLRKHHQQQSISNSSQSAQGLTSSSTSTSSSSTFIRSKSDNVSCEANNSLLLATSKSAINSNNNNNNNIKDNRANKVASSPMSTVNGHHQLMRAIGKSSKNPTGSIVSRRSILECDVTAYDLIEHSVNNNGDDLDTDNMMIIGRSGQRRQREDRDNYSSDDGDRDDDQHIGIHNNNNNNNNNNNGDYCASILPRIDQSSLRSPFNGLSSSKSIINGSLSLSRAKTRITSRRSSIISGTDSLSRGHLRIAGQGVHLRPPIKCKSSDSILDTLHDDDTEIIRNCSSSQPLMPEPDYDDHGDSRSASPSSDSDLTSGHLHPSGMIGQRHRKDQRFRSHSDDDDDDDEEHDHGDRDDGDHHDGKNFDRGQYQGSNIRHHDVSVHQRPSRMTSSTGNKRIGFSSSYGRLSTSEPDRLVNKSDDRNVNTAQTTGHDASLDLNYICKIKSILKKTVVHSSETTSTGSWSSSSHRSPSSSSLSGLSSSTSRCDDKLNSNGSNLGSECDSNINRRFGGDEFMNRRRNGGKSGHSLINGNHGGLSSGIRGHHRKKQVRFGTSSVGDDLIVEHINETIFEEDEPLYDDIANIMTNSNNYHHQHTQNQHHQSTSSDMLMENSSLTDNLVGRIRSSYSSPDSMDQSTDDRHHADGKNRHDNKNRNNNNNNINNASDRGTSDRVTGHSIATSTHNSDLNINHDDENVNESDHDTNSSPIFTSTPCKSSQSCNSLTSNSIVSRRMINDDGNKQFNGHSYGITNTNSYTGDDKSGSEKVSRESDTCNKNWNNRNHHETTAITTTTTGKAGNNNNIRASQNVPMSSGHNAPTGNIHQDSINSSSVSPRSTASDRRDKYFGKNFSSTPYDNNNRSEQQQQQQQQRDGKNNDEHNFSPSFHPSPPPPPPPPLPPTRNGANSGGDGPTKQADSNGASNSSGPSKNKSPTIPSNSHMNIKQQHGIVAAAAAAAATLRQQQQQQQHNRLTSSVADCSPPHVNTDHHHHDRNSNDDDDNLVNKSMHNNNANQWLPSGQMKIKNQSIGNNGNKMNKLMMEDECGNNGDQKYGVNDLNRSEMFNNTGENEEEDDDNQCDNGDQNCEDNENDFKNNSPYSFTVSIVNRVNCSRNKMTPSSSSGSGKNSQSNLNSSSSSHRRHRDNQHNHHQNSFEYLSSASSSSSSSSSSYYDACSTDVNGISNQSSGNNCDQIEMNKIVIDVPMAGSGYDYDDTHDTNEHIYEELDKIMIYDDNSLPILSDPSPNNGIGGNNGTSDVDSCGRSIFEGASKDEILEYLEDAKERVEVLIGDHHHHAHNSHSSLQPDIDEDEDDIDPSNHHHHHHNRSTLSEINHHQRTTTRTLANGKGNGVVRRIRTSNISNVSNSSTDSGNTATTSSSMDTTISTGGEEEDSSLTNSVCGVIGSGHTVERNDSGVGMDSTGSGGNSGKVCKIRRSSANPAATTATATANTVNYNHHHIYHQPSSSSSPLSSPSATTASSSPYRLTSPPPIGSITTSPLSSSTTINCVSATLNDGLCADCEQIFGNHENDNLNYRNTSANANVFQATATNNLNNEHTLLSSSGDYDGVDDQFLSLVCGKCEKKRTERKEIISEFVDTEFKYGRDLRIIREEFHRPMEVAGLLSKDQIQGVFINLDELISVNSKFSEKLQDAIDIATEQGDEDYTTVNIGKLFMESSGMLLSFETYCLRQGSASLLLNQLEKEKELLRIFLRVSQMENTLLRRMNLSAFLMVPVQRVTKYPLLLNRLYKVTPVNHKDREALRSAQQKVEIHLEHINQKTKGSTAPTKIWRKFSHLSGNRRMMNGPMDGLLSDEESDSRIRKTALEIVNWNEDQTNFVLSGRLLYMSGIEYQVNKRKGNGNGKFILCHAVLISSGELLRQEQNKSGTGGMVLKGNPNSRVLQRHHHHPPPHPPTHHHVVTEDGCCSSEDDEDPGHDSGDRMFLRNNSKCEQAMLILLKEKCNRFSPLKEPLSLASCVVSADMDGDDHIFEIDDLNLKESIVLKAETNNEGKRWFHQLSFYSRNLGNWRKRRNALANIMMVR